jgi:hypothetical protein
VVYGEKEKKGRILLDKEKDQTRILDDNESDG